MKKIQAIVPAAAAVAMVGTSLIAPTGASAAEASQFGKVNFGAAGEVDYNFLNKLQGFPSNSEFGKYFKEDGSLKETPESIEIDGIAYDYTQVQRGLALGKTIDELKDILTPVKANLSVESVSAITETTVDVAINAPKEDVLGATVVVKDGKNNVVEVNPVDISAGDTVASFTFKTAIKTDALVGVWTVDGKEYSFDAINQLKDITEAASGSDQVKLLSTLNAAGIKNIDEDKLGVYASAIVDASPETLADVQKAIDEVNKSEAEKDAEAAAVKAVVDATNQVQLLNALKANFEFVNADWNVKYAAAVVTNSSDADVALADLTKDNSAGVTFGAIQDAINGVNDAEVAAAYDKAFKSLKASDVSAARTLANSYLSTDKDAVITKKEAANDSLDVLDALIRVNTATTNNSLKTALVALDNLETTLVEKYKNNTLGVTVDDEFDIKLVNDSLLAEYRAEIAKTTDIGKKNQRKDIETIIKKVNGDTADTLLGKVTGATTADELLKALKAYPGVKQVSDINKASYWAETLESAPGQEDGSLNDNFYNVTDLDTVQAAVDAANLEAVGNATVSNIISKLNVFGLDNVVPANAVAYEKAKANIASATVGATNKATVENVKEKVAAVNKQVTVDAQVKAINDAETVLEVKTALDALANVGEVTDYLKIRSVDRDFVAAYVLDQRPEGGYNAAEETTALAAVAGKVTTAQGAHASALAGINGIKLTDTPDAVVIALDAILDETFDALSNTEKSLKAQEFQDKLVYDETGAIKTPFTTLAAVKELLFK